MIRWLWMKMMKWGWDYSRDLQEDYIPFCDDIQLPAPLKFKVQPATGGIIVEITHCDRKTLEDRVNLHIIPDSVSDMPQAIAQIVTIELLKA